MDFIAPGIANFSSEGMRLFSAGAAMPDGALGIWYADQYSSSPRPHIPNAVSEVSVSANLLAAPRRLFNNAALWSKSGVTVTDDAATAPDGSTEASTVVGTGNWFLKLPSFSYTLPPGTYTMAVSAKRNTGSDQQFCFSKDNTATRSSIFTATSTWQRFTYTFTLASSGNTNLLYLCSKDGSTAANLQICDFELFAGASDLGPTALSGHLYLGATAYDTRPAYSSGEVDFSAAGSGLLQLPTAFTGSASTAMAFIRKTGDGAGAYQAFLSKVQSYLGYTAWTDYPTLVPAPGVIAGTLFDKAGLWRLKNTNGHLLTHRASGTTQELWLDDILLFTVTGAFTAPSLRDFFVGTVNDLTLTPGWKLHAMALYSTALTDAQIRTSYAVLKARAVANGITPGTGYNIYCAEGDSITQPASGSSYAHLYGANVATTTFGVVRAVSGSTIANMVTRAASVDAIIPPSLAGRQPILSVLIGRNDLLGLGNSTYLTNLAAYLDARRAAGWTVVLGTLLPSTASGFNTARNTVNTTLRDWVGTHCDAIADFAADATMGPDAAASNGTYYSDGTHPTAAGQVILETVIRSVINAL